MKASCHQELLVDLDRVNCSTEIGSILYEAYADVPLFEVNHRVVHRERIVGWEFSGLSSTGLTHFHNIKILN